MKARISRWRSWMPCGNSRHTLEILVSGRNGYISAFTNRIFLAESPIILVV